ncbi:MAG: hypothetical protein R6V19_08650 [Armatimonadota bacterium]
MRCPECGIEWVDDEEILDQMRFCPGFHPGGGYMRHLEVMAKPEIDVRGIPGGSETLSIRLVASGLCDRPVSFTLTSTNPDLVKLSHEHGQLRPGEEMVVEITVYVPTREGDLAAVIIASEWIDPPDDAGERRYTIDIDVAHDSERIVCD